VNRMIDKIKQQIPWGFMASFMTLSAFFMEGIYADVTAENAQNGYARSTEVIDLKRSVHGDVVFAEVGPIEVDELGTDVADLEHEDLEREFGDVSGRVVYDPLNRYNRFMTAVNDKLYYWLLKPISKIYKYVIPESGRRAIGRCYDNAFFPVRLVNNLLQWKIKNAGTECARFGINTTVGILGLRDPAKDWLNLKPCDEDFGQTLGHYGVGSGFYLVLPVLGSSNLRDTIGMIPDSFLNPVYYLDGEGLVAAEGLRTINNTALHGEEYESFKKDAFDFYTFTRDVYEQNRKMRIGK
jgi:phospholipid-binding lipoprotein MlaA